MLLRIRQILNQHLSVKLKLKKLFRLTEHGIDLKYEIIWKMCFLTENTFVLDDNQSEYTPFAALQMLSPFFDKIPDITETSL